MVYIYPETKSTFNGDYNTATKSGYIAITESEYQDLCSGKKKWSNGKLVDDEQYGSREQKRKESEARRNRRLKVIGQINEKRAWFDYSYRQYFEKLMRFEALEIQEAVEDKARSKSYSTLNDLYLEAEIVRAEINELEQQLKDM